MAEENIPIDIESIKAIIEHGPEVVKTIKDLSAFIEKLATSPSEAKDSLQKLSSQINSTSQTAEKATNSSNLFHKSQINLALGLESLTTSLFGTSGAFTELGKSVDIGTGSISKSLDHLKDKNGSLGAAFQKLASLGGGAFSKMANILGTSIDEMVSSTERVQNIEKGFIAINAAAGSLGGVFNKSGQFVDDFSGKIVNLSDKIFDVCYATGMFSADVAKNMMILGRSIPDSLGSSVVGAKGPLSEFNAITQVAAATGREVSDVISDMKVSFEELNLKGQGAVDFLSSIALTSSNLTIPLDNVSSSLKKLSGNYSFLTNNTEGAVRAFNQFVPALQQSGLSSQQAITMFDSMAGSIKNMDLASKSFLAQRSGLGSGLQGAFKIDQLVSEGKIDQVMQAMQKNLNRQFGGNVVTLDQAAQSQQAAWQYRRQLAYVQSGAFGNIIQDKDQAAALFKAMKTGDLMKAAPAVKTGVDATKEITQRGSSVQQRMNTEVQKIAASVEKTAAAQDLIRAHFTRSTIGTGLGSPGKERLEDSMVEASAKTADVNKINYSNPANVGVDALIGMVGNILDIKRSYFDSRDKLGHTLLPKNNMPAPRGPVLNSNFLDKVMQDKNNEKTNQTNNALSKAVSQNMRNTNPQSPVAMANINNAKLESQVVTAQLAPGSISVKGTIEGFCLNCKQTMDVGHIHSAAVVGSQNASAAQSRSRITMPVRKGSL